MLRDPIGEGFKSLPHVDSFTKRRVPAVLGLVPDLSQPAFKSVRSVPPPEITDQEAVTGRQQVSRCRSGEGPLRVSVTVVAYHQRGLVGPLENGFAIDAGYQSVIAQMSHGEASSLSGRLRGLLGYLLVLG
jgi:hypothetical protein